MSEQQEEGRDHRRSAKEIPNWVAQFDWMCDVEEEYRRDKKSIAKSQFLVPKADFYEKRERSQEGIKNSLDFSPVN